jgi:hypothetical protein
LLSDCGLIERIVDMIQEEVAEYSDESPAPSHLRVSGSRRPVVGHVITIAQVCRPCLKATSPFPI